MKKILIPFDGSGSALRAVRHAAAIAKDNPAVQLHLLSVLDPMLEISQTTPTEEEIRRKQSEEAARIMHPAKTALEEAGVRFESSWRVGSPANEIADYGLKNNCEAIIMGTRGMGPIARVMIGSVATRVAHLSDLPITLIK